MLPLYRDRRDTAVSFFFLGLLAGMIFTFAYTATEDECAAGPIASVIR